MDKAIKIIISDPCHQKWENLTNVDNGRFCSSCQKVVIDFSKMTDNELIEYFKNYQGGTCGNLTPYQTNRLINPKTETYKLPKISRFFASFIGFFLSFSTKAQTIDTIKLKPTIEIAPISTAKVKPMVSNESDKKCKEEPNVEILLQGKLGGITIQSIEIEDRSKKLLKNNIYNNIEDILRHF